MKFGGGMRLSEETRGACCRASPSEVAGGLYAYDLGDT